MAHEGISNTVLASMYCSIIRGATDDIASYQQACIGRKAIEESKQNIGLFFSQNKSLDSLELPKIGTMGKQLLIDILSYSQSLDIQTIQKRLINQYSTMPENLFVEDEISLESINHEKIKGFKNQLYRESLENQL